MRQSALKALGGCTKKDFFGIAHVTSKDVAGAFKSGTKLVQETMSQKYQPLMQSREQRENQEHDVDVTFGRLRVDGDNIVRSHGQFEPTNERKLYETTDIKQKYVPLEETSSSLDSVTNNEDAHVEIITHPKVEGVANYNEPYIISEVGSAIDLGEVLKLFKTADTAEDLTKYSNKPPLTFYFRYSRESAAEMNEKITDNKESEQVKDDKLNFMLSGRPLHGADLESTITESMLCNVDTETVLEYDPSKDQIPLIDLDPESEEYHERDAEIMRNFDKFDRSIDEKFDFKEKLNSSGKALDYLKDVRAQRIEPTAKGLKHRLQEDHPYSLKPTVKLDSQGFRNYSNQVPNWKACRHIDILNYMQSAIVYNNNDILAINKPYGIASHPDDQNKDLDMNSIVQELATKMRLEKVYLAHRLDKDTTGVLLFSTSQKRAKHLNKLFAADEIKKTYWCVTEGVPKIEHAIIDIPIGKYKVAGKVRCCVVPEGLNEDRQLDKRPGEAKRAITEYKVLKSEKNAALIEVKPRSGVKHQIRCHMGFGLNTPILGDHKYSHLEKVAPQKLSESILRALHMRQAKARTLPMHLHAKSIVIPGAKANGETLFINAPLPEHFVENLKALGLWDRNLI